MAVERFIKPQSAITQHANRPAISRELLAMLGHHADVDPNALFVCDADAVTPWTVTGGASLVATVNRGTVHASLNTLQLDAQNERGAASILGGPGGLPVGTHILRVSYGASAAVAADLTLAVRNLTDATDVLAPTAFATVATEGLVEVLVTVRAADSGDTLELRLDKATPTANTIKVDYAAFHPAAARVMPYGGVPPGGSLKFTYAGSDVSAHTVYDGPAGAGNVIETAAYTYAGSNLTSIAFTRDGRTATKTFVYSGSNVDYYYWS